MSFDSKDNLYVANPYDFDLPIEEFAKSADGNVAPIAVLRGKHTKIVHDFGNISVDKQDRIVVAYEEFDPDFCAWRARQRQASGHHQRESDEDERHLLCRHRRRLRISMRPISTSRRTYRRYSSLRRMQKGTRRRCAFSRAHAPTSTMRTIRRSTRSPSSPALQ